MYLMNVPPVAATHTEWRTCGPPGGFSLPLCFNDSDTELSTRGSPISNNVQMIIESLRSTQSSLEMGDEIEGNMLSGQDSRPEVCKVAVGSFVGAKAKTKSPLDNQQTGVYFPIKHESSDSDSDDSVDRGIEEAILEYLKEKDDHKRKAEPCAAFLQSSKFSRKNPPPPEYKSDSSTFSYSNTQFPKSVKVEIPTAAAAIPIKKYIKNRASLDENPFKNFESNKMEKSLLMTRDQAMSPTKTISLFDKMKYPLTVKEEPDSNDSSSDDGIEEAIQRYQLEKKEQQNRGETFQTFGLTDESDSTSDDGIEEAIRSYQLQQLKERSVFLDKQKPQSKLSGHAAGSPSAEKTKRNKLRRKKHRAEKEGKSAGPATLSPFVPRSPFCDSQRGGNGFISFKVESVRDEASPAPPKVNTTAELMCAEAILDISKTVMPGAFHHGVDLNACPAAESTWQPSPPDNCPDNESDSSVDSEDGIEQEIMKFLEQKAQLHKQPASSAATPSPHHISEPERVKAKQAVMQKKAQRLSLTQQRKHKEENTGVSITSGTDNNMKDASAKTLNEQRKEASPFSQRSQTLPIAGLHKSEQSGDKSSSLDSDEDLDTAIKDLLKTKKKSKKKTRDLKRKSRKCLKEEESQMPNVLQTKMFKLDPMSKQSTLKKVPKSKNGMKEKPRLSKKPLSPNKKAMSKEQCLQEGETKKATEGQNAVSLYGASLQLKDDSSSVDSDDSIEQEIRKFLAEKAEKGLPTDSIKDKEVSRNGTTALYPPLHEGDIKVENQLAEIPIKSVPLSGHCPPSSPLSFGPPQDRLPTHTPQSLLPDNAISTISRLSSSARSESPLEPADGAGVVRSEPRRPQPTGGIAQAAASPPQRARPPPSSEHSRSEAMKWRQSLGLPTTDTRTPSRTSFHITSSKPGDPPQINPPSRSGGSLNPKSPAAAALWSSARSGRPAFTCSAEKAAPSPFRPPVLNFFSAARQHQTPPFTLGHGSQYASGETESMVHVPKDKSVFVELESDRTNHVQVRSRERSEGKERAEGQSPSKRAVASVRTDEKEACLERAEEEFIDDSDCESDSRRSQEKMQGFSTLSLSCAIDPGITIKPCIALTTEERCQRFNRRCLNLKSKKESDSLPSVPLQGKTGQHVKRKLQFIPVSRN